MHAKLSLIVTLAIVTQLKQTQTHSLPTTQEDCKCLKTNHNNSGASQLYVFGGGDDQITDAASRLNSQTGKWEPINGMLSAEELFCGAVEGKQIYLFGGYGGNQKNAPHMTNEAEVYDPLTDTYTVLRSMPELRSDCGAASLDGSVYVAGGIAGPTFSNTSSFIRYDIHSNQWSSLTPMNNVRRYLQMVELNGLLYAIGGNASKTVEVYNSKTDRWSFVASTQYSHDYFGATVYDGKIYAFSDSGFEVYSPSNNQWSTLNAPNDHLKGTKLVTMNDKLWALGGSYNDGTKWIQTKRVYTYDPSTDRWTKQHDMDVPRTYHTAFVVNP